MNELHVERSGQGSAADAVDAGLTDAMARLDRALAGAGGSGAALSFDAATPAPERELMGALSALGEGALSFAAEGDEGEEAHARRGSQLLAALSERAGAVVRIETEAGGRLVASTTVGLGGDVVSVLDREASPADLAQHVRSLARAQKARSARLRMLLSTLQATAKIAVALGTGNLLVALPAAWRFVRGVMTEWEAREQAA